MIVVMSLTSLEILEQAQFPPAQARAIARAIEIDSLAHREDLATKADLAELRHSLELAIEGVKTDCSQRMYDFSHRIYLAILGQTAVILGAVYFMFTHLR